MVGVFENGQEPTLEKVLETRENRAFLQRTLLDRFPGKTLISFKLNIPGPVKNNDAILKIYEIGREDILAKLTLCGLDIPYQKALDLETGPELFLVVEAQPQALKEIMIMLEDETPLGRIYDIDVLHLDVQGVRSMSRRELGRSSRRCLVCTEDAKVCGRSRAHSIMEMHEQMEQMMKLERRLNI